MSATLRRGLLWGFLTALLVGSLVYAFMPRPIPVELIEAREGPLMVTVDEDGETRVRDIYVLSSPVAGRILRIEGDVGDVVTQNETVVAQIEPADPTFLDPRSKAQAGSAVHAAESARDLAAADTRRVEADLSFARSELDRARALFRDRTISRREFDEAQRAYDTNKAALESARAALQMRAFELESARTQLLSPADTHQRARGEQLIPIRAPLTGRILRVINESERIVAAGEPLVEVGDPSDLEIVVDLLSADAVKVSAGQRVIIEGWGGGVPLEGAVRRVEPFGFTKVSALGIEEQRVNVVVDLITAREIWHRLGHGYQVDVRVVLWERDAVLRLPLTALFRDGDGWSVFVARDGRAEKRAVEIGARNGIEAQVIGGIEVGENVLAHPSDRVTDGIRIRARSA
jgi:HlyD family secretion protein